MYAQVEKAKEKKSRANANFVTQKKSDVKQGIGFMDNRQRATTQRKTQLLANEYTGSQPCGSESIFKFVDKRSEANVKRKLIDNPAPGPQVKKLSAFEEMGNRRALKQPVKPAPSSLISQNNEGNVIQKLKDVEGKEITEKRLTNENNLDTLRAWANLEAEDWEDGEILEQIRSKVKDLEDEAAQAAAIKAIRDDLETRAGHPLPNFSYKAQQQIKGIPRNTQATFFRRCQEDNVDPGTVARAIIGAMIGQGSGIKALVTFAKGTPLASAIRLAAEYDTLMDLRMGTIKGPKIGAMVTEGFLSVSKETYCDTPMRAGSVYIFSIALTRDRLVPEWHVHWGPHNATDAASFKDKRMAVGPGARVSTDESSIKALRQCIIGAKLWGP